MTRLWWILSVAFGFLTGALATVLLLHQRWRRLKISEHWSGRLTFEFSVGIFLATGIGIWDIEKGGEPLFRTLLEGLVHTLVVVVVLELAHTAEALDRAKEVLHLIHKDERIIFARENLTNDSSPVLAIGVETVRVVPEPLWQPRCGAAMWKQSMSFLTFNRLQDLLFCEKYIDHFFSLHKRAEYKSRILIVGSVHRHNHDQVVQSFLRISEGAGFATYIQREAEFRDMLTTIFDLIPQKHIAVQVRTVLEGNVDLSLTVDGGSDPKPWKSGQVNPNQDYLLRFTGPDGVTKNHPGERNDNPDIYGDGPINYAVLLWVYWLMSLGLHAPRRVTKAEDVEIALRNTTLWSREVLLDDRKGQKGRLPAC
jgi:hypothetical protein